MISALIVGGITTMFAVFTFLRATPNMALAMNVAKTPNPVTYVLTSSIGPTASDIFLWVVIIAFLSCGAAVEAAATRVFYSYARDRVIPFSQFLSHVSPKYQTPTNALWVSGGIALILSFSAKFESILTSFAVVGIYLAFQMIMLGALVARSRGMRADPLFNLKGWAWPINVLALIYGIGMIFNLARPTNPTAPWYINYEVILATAAIIILGILVYLLSATAKLAPALRMEKTNEEETLS
jgi:amino acid transporter